jgi:hypothetical protein
MADLESMADGRENFTLSGYRDGDFTFSGRLFSEGSFFDPESGALTRLRLFALRDNRLVYSVVSSSGERKDRRVYILKVENDICHIDNGRQSLALPVDMLFSAVFGLCGIDPAQTGDLRAVLEESLSSASA